MASRSIKRIILFSVVLAALVVYAVVVRDPMFMDSQERRSPSVFVNLYSSTGSYKFNPEKIIESISQGDENIFITPNEMSHIYSSSTALITKQSDYLKIADALHTHVWGEDTSDWGLNNMSFYGDCEYAPVGFDIVTFTYYKPTGVQQYSAHIILINPPHRRYRMGR